MQPEFAPRFLRCPICRRERTLALQVQRRDEREVREGVLHCDACGADFPVARGVGHLLSGAREHIHREAAGLERFAATMRAQGWDREQILRLPYIDDGYWFVQATSMQQLLSKVDFAPGQWLVDVGSNTCWASNRFAQCGLGVIALDISTAELQGLYTADYFIDDGTSYFERILGSMFDMPLASASVDYVFCCEVLHHNDPASLRRTFEEAFRVLKPGGKMFVLNETIKTVRDPVGVHVEAVEQYEGYEHAFWAMGYRWEAVRAGFRTRMIEPPYHWFFQETPPGRPSLRATPKARLRYELQRHPVGRRLYLEWLYTVRGQVQMNMIAVKPLRPRWPRLSRSRAPLRDSRPRTALSD